MGSIPGWCWVQSYQRRLKMAVVPASMVLMMKWGPQNITGWPGVIIMGLGALACGPMTCYPSEAALYRGH